MMALLAWALVGAIELVDLPNVSLGVLIVPFVEAAVWVTAIAITAYIASRVRRAGAALSVLTTLISGLVFIYLTNWSPLDPRSYYMVHRWGFAEVAELVHQNELGRPGEARSITANNCQGISLICPPTVGGYRWPTGRKTGRLPAAIHGHSG
jgi:hypothetical protein